MFRSRRNPLVKRLWKLRIRAAAASADSIAAGKNSPIGCSNSHRRQQQQQCCVDEKKHNEIQSGNLFETVNVKTKERIEGIDDEVVVAEMELKSVAHSLLKRLKEAQLSILVEAVENRGACSSSRNNCVLMPKGDIRIGRRTVLPHVLFCQLWRWNDVRQPFELKRLACCPSSPDDPSYICANPYHWSRLAQPESPPPYSRCAFNWNTPEEIVEDCDGVSSVATGGTNQFNSTLQGTVEGHSSLWCNLAYWEMKTRVGSFCHVKDKSIDVFADLPNGNGMSLSILAKKHETTNEAIKRTRSKIGYGLSISREDDGVWAYNRSDYAIFVNSPTLQPPIGSSSSSRAAFSVYKVPPGHSIKVFDYEKSRIYQKLDKSKMLEEIESGSAVDGPYDHNSVRISFAKGWGPKYSRQVITSCPCWLEILLIPPR